MYFYYNIFKFIPAGLDNKLILDNQAFTADSLQMSGDGITTNLTYENSKKILIASRHLRNDSRTIQLEQRYELIDKPTTKSKQHYRSSSCDVKITRSGSRNDYDRKPQAVGHSRNNSRDLCAHDFRQKLTHSRNNSSDHHNSNIKFILNYLNTPKVIVPTSATKKHSRNHSYDQIYMPHNIKIDKEFQKKFKKNLEQQMVVPTPDESIQPVAGTSSGSTGIRQHSRNNSKDMDFMNIQLGEDAQGNSCLRHRRTSSKDLNRINLATNTIDTDHSSTDCEPSTGFGVITYGDSIGKSRSDAYEDVI